MMTRHTLLLLALLATLSPARGATILLLDEGAMAPDYNGQFDLFHPPALNDNGTVAFHALLRNTSGGTQDDSGLFLWRNYALFQIAREGESPPEGDGRFASFNDGSLAPGQLNAADQLAFSASLRSTSGGSANDAGLYRGEAGGITRIVREGDAIPGSGGISTLLYSPAMNDAGVVASYSLISGGGSTLFRGDGVSIEPLLQRGDPAPDGNGSFTGPLGFGRVDINDAGVVAFRAGLQGTNGGSQDDTGFYRANGSAVTQIAREGQAAPDGNGELDSALLQPVINDRGQVAFWTFLRNTGGGNSDNQAIYRGEGGGLTRIARTGVAAPGGLGQVTALSAPYLNDSGQVAFVASISGVAGPGEGIFRGTGGQLTPLLHSGEEALDGNGRLEHFTGMAFNEAGVVAALFTLQGTSGGATDDHALYLSDGQERVRVAREGGTLSGASIVSLEFLGGYQGGSGLNRHGQVAFRATLDNGTSGLFLFTPELHWRSPYSGSWDSASWENPHSRTNWTLGLVPDEPHTVHIDPATSLTVTGPATDTTVERLFIGGGGGLATLRLQGSGTLSARYGFTVEADGILTGDGRIASSVSNKGTLLAENISMRELFNEGVIRGSTSSLRNRLGVSTTLTNYGAGEIRVGAGESLHLTGGAPLYNYARVTVIEGELESDGQVHNRPATGLIAARAGLLRFNGGLENAGSLAFGPGSSDVFGDIVNTTGGRIVNSGGSVIFYDDLVNDGMVQTSSGADSHFFGAVSGSGSFTGPGTVFLEGDLRPGNSPGRLVFEGDAFFGSASRAVFELAGYTRGVDYDAMDVGGTLGLGGTLEVTLTGGFTPVAGDSFDLFTYALLQGAFDKVLLPTLPGLDFGLLAGAGRLSLKVSAIPLPSPLWLLLGGLLALSALGHGRRSRPFPAD